MAALYAEEGEYTFSRGISWVAVTALHTGALPSLPGFPGAQCRFRRPWLLELYSYAWFVGFGIACLLYLVLRKMNRE